MKFIYRDDLNVTAFWETCRAKRVPFIQVKHINNKYAHLFFDVTDYPCDLEELSGDIKKIYYCYVDFFMCSDSLIDKLDDNYYFFELVVKIEHIDCIATGLYDYLLARLKN